MYTTSGGLSADDFDINGTRGKNSWNVWGQDFHLDRLEMSYQSLMNHRRTEAVGEISNIHDIHGQDEQQRMIREARTMSVRMLHALLEEASQAETMKNSATIWRDTSTDDDDDASRGPVVQLVRVTWLWSTASTATAASPPPSGATQQKHSNANNSGCSGKNKIVVRAHAVSSTQPFRVRQPIKPIICTIAVEDHTQGQQKQEQDTSNYKESDATVDASLPNRLDHPQSKVASWTRLRKKLENPESYKPVGVGEVLLVRPTTSREHGESSLALAPTETETPLHGGLELLEGLSSNLFVLYKSEDGDDGTPLVLRTAHAGVLHGYVRHLVLDVASTSSCGIQVSHDPILLQDVHRWKEAFITASSRLIVPISNMLLHDGYRVDGQGAVVPVFREIWRDPRLSSTGNDGGSAKIEQPPAFKKGLQQQQGDYPKWQELLDEILRRGGYD